MMKKVRYAKSFAGKLAAGLLTAATIMTSLPAAGAAVTVYADDDPNTGAPVTMIGAGETSHYDGEDNYLTNDEYDDFGLAINSPSDFDPEDESNPMGGEKGEAVIEQTLNELFIARGNYDGKHWTGYNTVMEDVPEATRDNLSFFNMVSNKFGGTDYYYSGGGGSAFRDLNILDARIQTANAVAFDMDGDGTDELAMTYLVYDAGKIDSYSPNDRYKPNMSYRVLRIFDYDENGKPFVVAQNACTLADNNTYWHDSSANIDFVKDICVEYSQHYASITAGDYDRDGFDEVAVYDPQAGKWESHVEVFDVSAKDGLKKKQTIKLKSLVTDGRFDINYWIDDRLPMCSLATTSISGKDDLVINAINPWYWGETSGYANHSMGEIFAIMRYDGSTMQQVVRDPLEYSDSCRLVFTSATDGDLNGNGVEELLIGGNWDTRNGGVDRDHNGLMVYCWNTENGGYEPVWSQPKKLEANSDIHYDGSSRPPTAIAAAKLISYSSKDSLFLNGVLFTMTGAKSEDGAEEKDNLASGNLIKFDRFGLSGTHRGAFILDVAVGNFVKGSINEEQICVITGDHQNTNSDHISLDYGFIYRELKAEEKTPEFDPSASLDPDNTSQWNLKCVVINNDLYSKYNNHEDGIYMCICPMNVDHDTIEYTYTGKTYGWSEPTLYSVVNAVPYWRELAYANGVPGTETWTVKVGSSVKESKSKGINAGVYFTCNSVGGFSILKNEISAGFATRFECGINATRTWGQSHAITDTLALALSPMKNYAVVYAMPVVSYKYIMHNPAQVVDQKTYDAMIAEDPDFAYKVGDTIPETDEEIAVVEQLTPTFSAIPVSTYNDLAGQYDLTEVKYGTNSEDDASYIPERTIGDPSTYPRTNSVFAKPTSVNNGKMAASVNTHQTVTLSHDETDSYDDTSNFQNRLNGSIGLTGKGSIGFIIHAEVNVGMGVNMTYTRGYSTTTGSTSGVTYSANFSRLPNGCEDYGFTAMLAMYNLPGTEIAETITPTPLPEDPDDFLPNGSPFVLDYVVTDLGMLPPEVNLNLRALASTSNSVLLKWDNPDTSERRADHYEIYLVNGDTQVKLGTVSGSSDTFVVSDLNPGTRYEFKLRAIGNKNSGYTDDPVSAFSSSAYGYTMSDSVIFTRQPESGVISANVGEYESESGGKAALSGTDAVDLSENTDESISAAGGSLVLSSEAEAAEGGRDVAYQWQRAVPGVSGTETFSNIDGATGNTYTVSAGELQSLGGKADYRVFAYINGGNFEGSYSNIANAVLERSSVNYHETAVNLALAETENENVYKITASVTYDGSDSAVRTGSVVFYSTPIDSDRDLYGTDANASDAAIIDTAVLSDDGTASIEVTAPEEGMIVGARYLAAEAGSDSFFGSVSNEIAVKADSYGELQPS